MKWNKIEFRMIIHLNRTMKKQLFEKKIRLCFADFKHFLETERITHFPWKFYNPNSWDDKVYVP